MFKTEESKRLSKLYASAVIRALLLDYLVIYKGTFKGSSVATERRAYKLQRRGIYITVIAAVSASITLALKLLEVNK